MQNDIIGTVLITEEQIREKAKEIGRRIDEDYAGKEIIMVGILRGAVPWMADVMKNVTLDMTIDFMAVSSYGAATKTSGVVKINKDLESNIDGKHVIIVEDIAAMLTGFLLEQEADAALRRKLSNRTSYAFEKNEQKSNKNL